MNCDSCKEARQGAEPVPYIVHEGTMARLERIIKRLWITIVILIFALIVTNSAWIWYEAQFVDESVWQEVDTGNGAAFVAGIGDVNYGENQAESDATNP